MVERADTNYAAVIMCSEIIKDRTTPKEFKDWLLEMLRKLKCTFESLSGNTGIKKDVAIFLQ